MPQYYDVGGRAVYNADPIDLNTSRIGAFGTTGEIALPVTLADFKADIAVDWSNDDARLTRILSAATAHAEACTQLALLGCRRWVVFRNVSEGETLRLPRSPAASLYAAVGDDAELDVADFAADLTGAPATVVSPAAYAVLRIEYDTEAGGDLGVLDAVRMLAAERYRFPEGLIPSQLRPSDSAALRILAMHAVLDMEPGA